MESKKINQLATELSPDLSDLTIIGDPTTGISKKITLSQMASLFTGTVEEYANLAAFPLVGVADTIYIAQDTNIIYRWSGSAYVELSPNVVSSLVFNDANGFDGTIVLASSVATLTITTALTLGSLPFIGASGALTQDNANLFYDDTNNRLGIGTNAPTTVLDVFGSGIIARINGTSTNNGFLGFSNAGTNKWSVGNVQSDHRFRIYSEANTAELVSVLQTGEFGIGIANPLTKLHIDGGATALIANLDANVSVAKSLSFRSDNSNRINLEVSGTESGSNAGADYFLRTFTDAGSLLETPFSIVRSTGVTTIKSLTLTNVLSVANGGTGSATQNFVDLTTTQSIGGAKTFTSALVGTTFTGTGLVINNNGEVLRAYGTSPNVSFYNAANTTRGGYVNHDGTNINIVANVGVIALGSAISGTSATFTGKGLIERVQVGTAATINDATGVGNTLQFANYSAGVFVTASADSYIYKTSGAFGGLSAQTLIFQTRSDVAGGGFAFVAGSTPSAVVTIASTGTATFSGDIIAPRLYTFEKTGTVAGSTTATVNSYSFGTVVNTWYEIKVTKSRNTTTGFGRASAIYHYYTGDLTGVAATLKLIGGDAMLSVDGSYNILITNLDTTTNNWGATFTKINTN